jgi:hypothetical protein
MHQAETGSGKTRFFRAGTGMKKPPQELCPAAVFIGFRGN